LVWLIKKSEKLKQRKEREKRFFGSLAGRKRVCIFSARDVAKNVRERSNEGIEKQEGSVAKLKCQ
jgi:hypothetical protein